MLRVVITDLVEIRGLAESKQAENLDFRRYLEAHHHTIGEFQALAARFEREMDCTLCANCCRATRVGVSRDEIGSIASHLGTGPDLALRQYTTPDPAAPSQRLLAQRGDACVFLHRNLCLVYEARPAACRDFPHVGEGMHTVGSRMSSMTRRAEICPIVYNALEAYKARLGFPRSHGSEKKITGPDSST